MHQSATPELQQQQEQQLLLQQPIRLHTHTHTQPAYKTNNTLKRKIKICSRKREASIDSVEAWDSLKQKTKMGEK